MSAIAMNPQREPEQKRRPTPLPGLSTVPAPPMRSVLPRAHTRTTLPTMRLPSGTEPRFPAGPSAVPSPPYAPTFSSPLVSDRYMPAQKPLASRSRLRLRASPEPLPLLVPFPSGHLEGRRYHTAGPQDREIPVFVGPLAEGYSRLFPGGRGE